MNNSKPEKRDSLFKEFRETVVHLLSIGFKKPEYVYSFFCFIIVLISFYHIFTKTQLVISIIGVSFGTGSIIFHNSRKNSKPQHKKFLGFILFTVYSLLISMAFIIFIPNEVESCTCDPQIQNCIPQSFKDFFGSHSPIIKNESNLSNQVTVIKNEINTTIIIPRSFDILPNNSNKKLEQILNSSEFEKSEILYIQPNKADFEKKNIINSLFDSVSFRSNGDSNQPWLYFKYLTGKKKYLVGFTESKLISPDSNGKTKLTLVPTSWGELDDLVIIPENVIFNISYFDLSDDGKLISVLNITIN